MNWWLVRRRFLTMYENTNRRKLLAWQLKKREQVGKSCWLYNWRKKGIL